MTGEGPGRCGECGALTLDARGVASVQVHRTPDPMTATLGGVVALLGLAAVFMTASFVFMSPT